MLSGGYNYAITQIFDKDKASSRLDAGDNKMVAMTADFIDSCPKLEISLMFKFPPNLVKMS